MPAITPSARAITTASNAVTRVEGSSLLCASFVFTTRHDETLMFASSREKRPDNKTNTPLGRSGRSFGINFCANRELDPLFPDLCELAHQKIDRDRPLFVMPVVGAFRVQGKSGVCLCCIGNEGLEERRADVSAMFIPRK